MNTYNPRTVLNLTSSALTAEQIADGGFDSKMFTKQEVVDLTTFKAGDIIDSNTIRGKVDGLIATVWDESLENPVTHILIDAPVYMLYELHKALLENDFTPVYSRMATGTDGSITHTGWIDGSVASY